MPKNGQLSHICPAGNGISLSEQYWVVKPTAKSEIVAAQRPYGAASNYFTFCALRAGLTTHYCSLTVNFVPSGANNGIPPFFNLIFYQLGDLKNVALIYSKSIMPRHNS